MLAAAAERERDGQWTNYALGGSVRFEPKEIPDWMSPLGTAPDVAGALARNYIRRQRKILDDLEKTLDCYGPHIAVATYEPVVDPGEKRVIEALKKIRAKARRIMIHGVEFNKDSSGAFRRVAPQ